MAEAYEQPESSTAYSVTIRLSKRALEQKVNTFLDKDEEEYNSRKKAFLDIIREETHREGKNEQEIQAHIIAAESMMAIKRYGRACYHRLELQEKRKIEKIEKEKAEEEKAIEATEKNVKIMASTAAIGKKRDFMAMSEVSEEAGRKKACVDTSDGEIQVKEAPATREPNNDPGVTHQISYPAVLEKFDMFWYQEADKLRGVKVGILARAKKLVLDEFTLLRSDTPPPSDRSTVAKGIMKLRQHKEFRGYKAGHSPTRLNKQDKDFAKMADAHEQQHKGSSAKNEVSMTNEKTLRDRFKEVKGKAKRLVAYDEILESERKTFESEKEDFESERKGFESQKTDFKSQKTDLESQKTEFELQNAEFGLQNAEFGLQKADFELKKMIFASEEMAFMRQKANFESEKDTLREIEETREGIFKLIERCFMDMEEELMLNARDMMRGPSMQEREIESRMWCAKEKLASFRMDYDYSKQLYSVVAELTPSPFSLTEVPLRPSVEEEFA
ncbi:hypothetical protein THAR02_02245 [Trichoderma harzianum]|uniref:Uncharacterized protein n=1 Tax=Trichoderma harzianum TaxID=5544 RepID=A0A0F9XLP4_TRIHA|nr:hypothetical protein THAR02_02245 [Trichoderma harzianum]